MNEQITHKIKIIKQIMEKTLSVLFPFQDLNARPSVFIQDTWLEKVMKPTQVKDYLWVPSKH